MNYFGIILGLENTPSVIQCGVFSKEHAMQKSEEQKFNILKLKGISVKKYWKIFMTDVQFEENEQFSPGGSFQSRQISGMPTTPGMIRLLGKFGIRNEKIAGYILIIIAVVAFTVSIFIFANVFNRGAVGAGPDTARIGPPAEEI